MPIICISLTSLPAHASSSLSSLAILRIRMNDARSVDAVWRDDCISRCTAWYGSVDMMLYSSYMSYSPFHMSLAGVQWLCKIWLCRPTLDHPHHRSIMFAGAQNADASQSKHWPKSIQHIFQSSLSWAYLLCQYYLFRRFKQARNKLGPSLFLLIPTYCMTFRSEYQAERLLESPNLSGSQIFIKVCGHCKPIETPF